MHVFVHMYKSGPNNPFIPHHLDFQKPHVMHRYVHMPLNMYKKNLQQRIRHILISYDSRLDLRRRVVILQMVLDNLSYCSQR